MKKVNKIKLFVTLGLFILIVVAMFLFTNDKGDSTGLVVDNRQPIKIGGAFALTGFASEWGAVERNGAILAIEEINAQGGINGREVKLIVEDTLSDGKGAINAVQKLINIDNVEVIVGPSWLDSFGGAAPIADENNIVFMTPSASIDAIKSEHSYDYVFSTWYRTDKESEELAKHLSNANKKRIILFF